MTAAKRNRKRGRVECDDCARSGYKKTGNLMPAGWSKSGPWLRRLLCPDCAANHKASVERSAARAREAQESEAVAMREERELYGAEGR
jgi:hypothetical protein